METSSVDRIGHRAVHAHSAFARARVCDIVHRSLFIVERDIHFRKPQTGFQSGEELTMRKIAARQITASDLNTFTITFPVNTRMKFVMSGDELISSRNVRTL